MKNCDLKCPNCFEDKKIIATVMITKDMETEEYLKKKFEYKCRNCNYEWVTEYNY